MIRRVNKGFLCPVCLRGDWCGVATDGAFAICMRVRSDYGTRNNGWMHNLNGAVKTAPRNTTSFTGRVAEKRSPGGLDLAYQSYLQDLSLTENHRGNLTSRGLSESLIEENFYRSIPEQRFVCGDWRGVPGFYNLGNQWCITQTEGFYIPIRNSLNKTIALQIRRDGEKPKYVWFSSGVSSGAPIHFRRPELIEQEVLITEGALKADCISGFEERPVIGIAGVSVWPESFGLNLKKRFPQLRIVTIAFDSDWRTNPQVKQALLKLVREIERSGMAARVKVWDSQFKGYDDYLRGTHDC